MLAEIKPNIQYGGVTMFVLLHFTYFLLPVGFADISGSLQIMFFCRIGLRLFFHTVILKKLSKIHEFVDVWIMRFLNVCLKKQNSIIATSTNLEGISIKVMYRFLFYFFMKFSIF